MTARIGRAAICFAALVFATGVAAQDVTLTARDGALSVEGTLQGFDGEFYRILSPYGPLTLDAEGVLCDGPACPSLTAPKATIRILGAAGPGSTLMPALFAAFAAERGLTFTPATDQAPALLADPETNEVLAEMSFAPAAPEAARAALTAGSADLVLAQAPSPDLDSRPIAMDALVPIVAPGNPVARIASTALARVLAGQVSNWSEVGGPDMPLVLHSLSPSSDLGRALAERLGQAVVGQVTHDNLADLAQAVAQDPWAIAVTGLSATAGARVLDLTDSCGFPLHPTALAVKAEDYPLAVPVFLDRPPRRLPLMAREFLDFLASPPAQAVVARLGYIDRRVESAPLPAERLAGAIRVAGKDATVADFQALVLAMDGAERSSLTFRFNDGSATLDAQSLDNLATLAKLIEVGAFKGKVLILAGFSDGNGSAKANLRLSRDRAASVRSALEVAAPDVAEDLMPQVMAFGGLLPVACDSTPAGKRLNRRVELWMKPDWALPPGVDPAPKDGG